MSNLEMIKSAFGVNLNIVNPFSGKKRTEAEVLIREGHRIGAYWCTPSVSSTVPLAYRSPKCLYGLALFLALDGDHPRLKQVCETHLRLERVRVVKERDLKMMRDARITELRQDGLVEVLGDTVVDRYNRAQKALSRAIREEVVAIIDNWEVEPAKVGEAWGRYFGAENALKESLVARVLDLGWKSRV